MHIVAAYGWQKNEAETAKAIAEALGILVFEARQKMTGGGPTVLVSFADSEPAKAAVHKLTRSGVPALMIDTQAVRSSARQPIQVGRFELGSQGLQVESVEGQSLVLDYASIALLLVAIGSSGQVTTSSTETKRKFSLGKTLLAGGIPMTKKVKTEVRQSAEERDKILWLYTRDQKKLVLDRAALDYTGLGDAMQLSRDLNFTYLENELRRRAPRAIYDNRLLKRAGLVQVLGQPLDPETDLDLAFEILARALWKTRSMPAATD